MIGYDKKVCCVISLETHTGNQQIGKCAPARQCDFIVCTDSSLMSTILIIYIMCAVINIIALIYFSYII